MPSFQYCGSFWSRELEAEEEPEVSAGQCGQAREKIPLVRWIGAVPRALDQDWL